MENKITLPGLSAILAQRSGLTKRLCEDFVKELFQLISSELANGESVKIKEIGTFRLTKVEPRMSVDVATGDPIEIPGHNKVSFIPAKSLSEGVNAPFEAFEAVEVPQGYSLEEDHEGLKAIREERDDLELMESPVAPAMEEVEDGEEKVDPEEIYYEIEESEFNVEPDSESESDLRSESDSGSAISPESESASESESESELETESESETESETDTESESVSGPVQEPEQGEPQVVNLKPRSSSRFGWGFFIGFASCLIVFGVLGFIGYRTLLDKIESVAEPVIPKIVVEEADSSAILADEKMSSEKETPIASADTKPSDIEEGSKSEVGNTLVYDTISRTRYLTTMAKEHYGNYNLWPYIYEENKAILGHPDRIKPGTRVVIPSLKKYGVDPTSKADIDKARNKGLAIYARFANTR